MEWTKWYLLVLCTLTCHLFAQGSLDLLFVDPGKLDTDGRATLLDRVLSLLGDEGKDPEVVQAAQFLVQFMPENDVKELSPAYIADNIHLAFLARRTFAWGSQVPWPLFLNEVLPYASLTEPRDAWREPLLTFMRTQVSNCTTARCAVLQLNARSWEIVQPAIIYAAAKANGLNSYSPLETMRRHNSSCTGLSIFLIDALRSVGIPARIAGIPHWNRGQKTCPHGDADALCGNHNWVETFVEGEWHFIDQRGAVNKLDVGWFFPDLTDMQRHSVDGFYNHSVFASSWAPTQLLKSKVPQLYQWFEPFHFFPLAWDWENKIVPAWEAVRFYHFKSPNFN